MAAHILLLDDDTTVLEMMRLALSVEGYQVSTSERVFEDLAEVEQLRPDLIILDWKMRTGPDGGTFLQRLKLSPTTATIPILICTGAADQVQEQEQTLRQQGIPFLYKPFGLDELLEQVRQLLA